MTRPRQALALLALAAVAAVALGAEHDEESKEAEHEERAEHGDHADHADHAGQAGHEGHEGHAEHLEHGVDKPKGGKLAAELPKGAVKKYTGSMWEGFVKSWTAILASEIGDKTFFIACLMAMRNDRFVVFSGAISALAAMTILSAAIGHIVPTLLPVKYTQIAAVILFGAFGVKLLNEARTMEDEDEPDELAEAQAELAKKEEDYGDMDIEAGAQAPIKRKVAPRGLWGRLFGPVFIQAFTLTFVAEWGDRSQIATIVFAAAWDPYGVTLGGIVGHSICTGSAVLIGKSVANTFTPRHVTLFGGVLFMFFAFLTAYQMMYPAPQEPITVH